MLNLTQLAGASSTQLDIQIHLEKAQSVLPNSLSKFLSQIVPLLDLAVADYGSLFLKFLKK